MMYRQGQTRVHCTRCCIRWLCEVFCVVVSTHILVFVMSQKKRLSEGRSDSLNFHAFSSLKSTPAQPSRHTYTATVEAPLIVEAHLPPSKHLPSSKCCICWLV